MQLVIDDSQYSGTALDRDIVAYAESNYDYPFQRDFVMDDSEQWQWEADEAISFMNDIEFPNRYYMIEENSLYLMEFEDIL